MSDTVLDGLILVRWVHFAAIFAIFGSGVFWSSVGRSRRAGLPRSVARTQALVGLAAWVAAISGLGWLAATIANMTGGFGGLLDNDTLHAFFLDTDFGPIEVARLAVLALIVGITFRRPSSLGVPATLAGLLLVSQAWLGHAAEGGETRFGAAMIAAYAVHVLAAAAWVGGLPSLSLAIAEARRTAGDARAEILAVLSRYSGMALLAVTLVVASGVANAAFRTAGSLSLLVGSQYGAVLAVKIVLVTAMLAIAAFNRLVTMPRLSRGTTKRLGRLAASILVETALGLAVLALAAVLGVTPPPA